MKRLTKNHLIAIANEEIRAWRTGESNHDIPRPLLIAIYWAFIHRVTEGETIEEFFSKGSKPLNDYQI